MVSASCYSGVMNAARQRLSATDPCSPPSVPQHQIISINSSQSIGVTYPAQLVNLPCPVEVHKTLDHASYYKSADIAQMLIVYEDHLSFDEAQEKPVEGFPSYYHSGLTPPMKRVVERRFERTFTSRDRKAVPPPRTAVQDVEDQLLTLMEKLQKDEKAAGGNAGSASNKRSNKLPVLTSATKDLVEIEEEVVEYEPWMDANGSQPYGIEFDAEDALAKIHPQVWLPAEQVQSIQEEMRRAEEEAAEKEAAKAAAAAAAAAPPKPKKKKKKAKAAAAAAEEPAGPRPKKGIPSRKNTTPVDELTQAAMAAMGGDDLMNDVLGSDDLFADLDLEFPGL